MSQFVLVSDVLFLRITGLDPAHFGFFPPLLEKPLSSNDAGKIDIVCLIDDN